MAQERLTVRKIREIIRLKVEAGLSDRAIAGASKVSNSTVGENLGRVKPAGLRWPSPDLGEDELYRRIFPERNEELLNKYSLPFLSIHKTSFPIRLFSPKPLDTFRTSVL